MIKVVMVDLDGTLLDEEKRISKRTVATIKEFQDKGGLFVVNTGRGYSTASKIVKEAGIRCDYICLSGAGIYDEQGNCIKSDCMTIEEILLVRELERKYGLGVNYLTSEGAFSECSREWAESYYLQEEKKNAARLGQQICEKNALQKYQGILNYIKYNSDIEKVISDNIPIYKMVIMGTDCEQYYKAREEFQRCSCFKVAITSEYSMEINAERVDKGKAAIDYIKSKGYEMDEVMAIGDSDNDYPMLILPFGKTVAMENGDMEIKKICTDITCSNAEDGVAKAMEKWCMDRKLIK